MFRLIFLAAVVVLTTADVSHLQPPVDSYPHVRILKQESELDPQGNYKWSFDAENGISAAEHGALRQVGPQEVVAVQGSFEYTSPEGLPVSIVYVADENGFQPQGDVLPTPPPIPLPIQRALEWIKAHPQPAQAKYN